MAELPFRVEVSDLVEPGTVYIFDPKVPSSLPTLDPEDLREQIWCSSLEVKERIEDQLRRTGRINNIKAITPANPFHKPDHA